MGELEKANVQMTKVFFHLPNHPSLLQSQGNLALSANDQEPALESFSSAWEMDKDLRKSANNLIVFYQKEGDIPKPLMKSLQRFTHSMPMAGIHSSVGLGSRI